MAIIKWDPFATLPTLQDRINSIFEEAFPSCSEKGEPAHCDWRPVVDTYEEGSTIVIIAELPGVNKEDISIDVKENTIRITGQRPPVENVQNKKFFRRERCHGNFFRAFSLPENAVQNQIQAFFKNGLLKIVIHRSEESHTKKIEIN